MGHRRHIIGSHHPIPLQYPCNTYPYPMLIHSVKVESGNGSNLEHINTMRHTLRYQKGTAIVAIPFCIIIVWILSEVFISILNDNTTIGFIYLTTQEIIHWLVNIQYR